MGMIHLRAEGGIPIGMSLPLHPTITEQWKNGELTRVTAEGGQWLGDPFDLSSADEGESPEFETDEGGDDGQDDGEGGETGGDGQEPGQPAGAVTEPERPDITAPVKAWRDYAAALGATTAEEAAGMSKPDLIKLCTPPEADPLAGA